MDQDNNQRMNENYLFFSSQDMIEYFLNNLTGKDMKTQAKRILEMARVFMAKKGFELSDIYSIFVMVRDLEDYHEVNKVFQLYFKEGNYPIRVFIQSGEFDCTADIEMEISAYRGEKRFINSGLGHIPKAPYSQAVIIDNLVHCSGVCSVDPVSQKGIEGDFKQKVKRCLENLELVLQSAGTELKEAYTFMVYLKDLEMLPQVEEVFSEYYSEQDEMMQEVCQVEKLCDGYELEISCSAYLR